MPVKKDNDFIKNYEKIRPVLRDVFLYGCFYRGDFQDKRGISAPKVDNEKRKIIAFLDSRFVRDKNGKSLKRRKFLQLLYNMFYVHDNYLKTSYFIKKISTNDVKRIIAVLLILSTYESATNATICGDYWDTFSDFYEEDISNLKQKNTSQPDKLNRNDHITTLVNQKIRRCLLKLADSGYITAVGTDKTTYYTLSPDVFQNLTKADFEELLILIHYFSGVSPISVPGYTIQKIIQLYRQHNYQDTALSYNIFLFKGTQIKQILEEETAGKLLSNIAKQEIITFEYHEPYQDWKEYKPVRPVKLLLDIFYGRWFLIALSAVNENNVPQLNAYRLDRIRNIKIESTKSNQILSNFPKQDIDKLYEKIIKNSWAVSLLPRERSTPVLVELLFYINENNEQILLERVRKEGRFGKIESLGSRLYKFSICVNDPWEMKPWIRSFTGYVKVVANNEDTLKLKKSLEAEWEALFKRYGIIS